MGWASCFENNFLRYSESALVATDGPAYQGSGITAPRRPGYLPPNLAAAFGRLQRTCERIAQVVAAHFHPGELFRLEQDMDSLMEEIAAFERRNILAAESDLMSAIRSLSSRLMAIQDRTNLIRDRLGGHLRNVETELRELQPLKSHTGGAPLPPWAIDVEKQAVCLLHSWRAVQDQIQELCSRHEELSLKLVDKSFPCLITRSNARMRPKDEKCD